MTEDERQLLRAALDPPRDGLSIRDWQRVNRLIDDPASWEAEPAALLVLRKRRDRRQRYSRVRSAR